MSAERGSVGLQKDKIELGKSKEAEQYGKQLTENTIQELSAGQSVPRSMEHIYEIIDKNQDIFGPVYGRVNAANPYDDKSQTIRAKLKTEAQAIGKYLEGGVLRKEDEKKYEEMLPKLSDTPELARNKAALVAQKIKEKFENDYKNLKASKYDVRAFEQNPLKDLKIPSFLPGSQGLQPGAIEDGHRFKGGNPADPNSWEVVR